VTLRARSHGEAGARWLRALPGLVGEIERRWSVTVGETLDGGTAAFVAPATTADGDSVVVKIAFPDELDDGAFSQSVRVYELAEGRGCATLLAHDAELSAILLERLGRSLSSLGLPIGRQVEIICTTVRQVWVPVPAETPLPTGAEKAHWLSDFIATTWEALDRPCSARAVDIALEFAAERAAAFDRESAVLVHGDAHEHNTLEDGRGAFKLVDPEGLISEPAHDLAVPMRGLNAELLAGDARRLGLERARFVARLTGVDETAIWQWGFVERVSSGLYIMSLGLSDGDEFLAVADRWAESDRVGVRRASSARASPSSARARG
jgi:streptomycin 6-kinase